MAIPNVGQPNHFSEPLLSFDGTTNAIEIRIRNLLCYEIIKYEHFHITLHYHHIESSS